jgi:hypothetical protein
MLYSIQSPSLTPTEGSRKAAAGETMIESEAIKHKIKAIQAEAFILRQSSRELKHS